LIHILVIENNKEHLELTKIQLEQSNYNEEIQVHTAQDLENGKKIITEEKIDCIFLDLGLPKSEGIDTVKNITTYMDEQNKDIPIVVYTSLEDYEIAKEAFKLGIKQFIVKGKAEIKELIRAINSSLYEKYLPERPIP